MSEFRNHKPLVQAKALGKHVITADGRLDILKGIDCDIKSGETLAIVGASGSGKSTLLALLAGLDTPTEGMVWLAGHCLNELDEDGRAHVRGVHVGFVFQSFLLLPQLSALENVMLPLELIGVADARHQAEAMLHRVGLGPRLKHHPRELSGGEQQRVALARAFVTRPSVLFADEPTGNLDSRTGQLIIDLLFELNHQSQTTLVLVTHDDHLASRCDRTLALAGGIMMATCA